MSNLNGDSVSPKTYAEVRPSPFEPDKLYKLDELLQTLTPTVRYRLGSAKRQATVQATILALKRVQAEKGVELFEGRKVQRVYLAAARECGWFVKTPTVVQTPYACGEGNKFCPRCRCAKPQEDFSGPATATQRRMYKWAPGYAPNVSHQLCAPCRVLKARQDSYAEKKRALKKELRDSDDPQVVYWAKLRKSIRLELASTRMAYQSRKHRFTDAEGVKHSEVVFSSFAHKDYYDERKRLGLLAQATLKKMVDHGELPTREAKPIWYTLLDVAQREWLSELYRRVVWSNKGITPSLWGN
jgi:hypothetical protein